LDAGAIAGIAIAGIAIVSTVAAVLLYDRYVRFFQEENPSDLSDVGGSAHASAAAPVAPNAEVEARSDGTPSVVFQPLI
jgi:hypothetical protein